MMLTLEQLAAAMPYAKQRTSTWLAPLNAAMSEFEINTPLRIAAFLATISVESGQLRYVEEIASGEAYEGRRDLGNVKPSWGVLYKGRGLIQITGYYNYTQVHNSCNIDCISHPELLCQPINAARTAAWFFRDRGLNTLADKQDFLTLSIIVNGKRKDTGLPNGWDERQAAYKLAKGVLKC